MRDQMMEEHRRRWNELWMSGRPNSGPFQAAKPMAMIGPLALLRITMQALGLNGHPDRRQSFLHLCRKHVTAPLIQEDKSVNCTTAFHVRP